MRHTAIKIVLILLWMPAAVVCPDNSPAAENGSVISVQLENDLFGGTDRNFTHGTRLEYVTGPIDWISDAANKLPWFEYEKSGTENSSALEARASISIGQNIYTPESTRTRKLMPNERPYAGWLYVGFGLAANQGSRRYDKVYLEIGTVGPDAFAEEVQTSWHNLFSIKVPRGWDNQLDNEPGVVFYYEQARRFDAHDLIFGLEYDVLPHFGGGLGNVFTYGAVGFTVRVGSNLEEDFGPPRIRPSLPGSGFFRPEDDFNWYVFAGSEARLVLRNIFLDGNTFTDSPSVDKNMLVGDVQAGFAVQRGRFQMTYTQIYRTKEYEDQSSGDLFGSLNIAWRF
ncbi:MAG: lipid A deacylase LpxR family protein [Desulfobacterales bacterium]